MQAYSVWLLRPDSTISSVLPVIKEAIIQHVLRNPGLMEDRAAIVVLSNMVSDAVGVLKDKDRVTIFRCYSMLNSIELCLMRQHLHFADTRREQSAFCLCSLSFGDWVEQLDRLRERFFSELVRGKCDVALTKCAHALLVPQPKQTRLLRTNDIEILSGLLLCDPLAFPVTQFMNFLYPSASKAKEAVVLDLLMHTKKFAGLSFVRASLHLWSDNVLHKKLNNVCFPSSALSWFCQQRQLLASMLGNGAPDAFLCGLQGIFREQLSLHSYLSFACGHQTMFGGVSTSPDISPSLNAIAEQLGAYPILSEPEEYMQLTELIGLSGAAPLLEFLTVDGVPHVHKAAGCTSNLASLLSALREALLNYCDVYSIKGCQTILCSLLALITDPQSKLLYPEVSLIVFSLLTCYFHMPQQDIAAAFSMRSCLDISIVQAVLQFELLAITAFHGSVIDAHLHTNPVTNGQWLEVTHLDIAMQPVQSSTTDLVLTSVRKEQKSISLHKVLGLPLSDSVADMFRDLAKQTLRSRTVKRKYQKRHPFLRVDLCKFLVELPDGVHELSLMELLVLDMHSLGRGELVKHMRFLWDCTPKELDERLDALLVKLGLPPLTTNSPEENKAPKDRERSSTLTELLARAAFLRLIKYRGSLPLESLLETLLNRDNSNQWALSGMDLAALHKLVDWSVESGYTEIINGNVVMLND